jgi:hypothetical protein
LKLGAISMTPPWRCHPDLPDDAETKLLLAMAAWKCGDRPGARRWYEQAVRQMDYRSRRIHAEAAALLGVAAAPAPGSVKPESRSSK